MTSSLGVSQMPGFVASQKDYRKETAYNINQSCTIGSNECDSTKGLFCNSSRCQCDYSTKYWNINFEQCQQRLNCSQMYVLDSDCMSTLICPTVSSACNCPLSVSDMVCNCASTKYYDSTLLQLNRASLSGLCLTSSNYTCLISLYCNADTCACPIGTIWIAANTTCVATGYIFFIAFPFSPYV
ncbi:unnamed protein product [Rotaria socialis]|uniref:EB domain-containing protein n=1 Tax=Rotaria socialis TaxID=392032 RepID=A0A817SV91_9BILA|nr:unnamed protein product [Rotaria socialis]